MFWRSAEYFTHLLSNR